MGAMAFSYDLFAWGESLLQFKIEDHRRSLAMAIQALGSSSARNDIKTLKQAIMAYPMPQAAAIEGALQLLHTDLRADFAALKLPIAGFYGRLDSLVPVAVVEQLQQMQPQARFTVAAHASHAPFISHPQVFGHWLQHWLAGAI